MILEIPFSHTVTSQIKWEVDFAHEKVGDTYSGVLAVVDSNALWYFDETITRGTRDSIIPFVLDNPDEDKKSQQSVDAILDFLFSNGADRRSLLLAVGGGVVLDLAGYVASIYKRGIDWIAVPTTLLSQVDASVGGKTAINHARGKNAIGAFYPPKEVYINSGVSDSWEEDIRLEGIAEMYKIFTVFDIASRDSLVNGITPQLTKRSIELKAQVVMEDPWEKSLRALLNYGHTFGHAIETATGLPHGICVSIGIRIENLLAVSKNLMQLPTARCIEQQLNTIGFPRPKLPEVDVLLPYIFQDKKNVGGRVLLSLVDGEHNVPIVSHEPRTEVTIDELIAAHATYQQNELL
jgi:3-dehydroquinate synthase